MPSRSYRNNNPGNIRFGKFSQGYGAIDDGGGYAKFPTVNQGLAAMVDLLAVKSYRTLTLEAAIARYAPAEDQNKPREYAAHVAAAAMVSISQRLDGMDPFQILDVIRAMIRFEGWKP